MGWGFGGFLNSITGVSSAAKQQQNYAVNNSMLNNAFQKEFAQNSVQWHADDLEKAGFNRAIAATNGTSASGGGSFTGGSGGGTNPMDLVNSIVGMYNQTTGTNASNQNLDAQSTLAKAQAIAIIEKLPLEKKEKQAYINNLIAQTGKLKGGVSGAILGSDYNIDKGINGWINTFNHLFKK